MASGRRQYPFHLIEPKRQRQWEREQAFRAWNPGEQVPVNHGFSQRHPGRRPEDVPKFYILDMFPYPSGAGLHVGHPEGYTATDILARYKRARGFHVLHPMGWDAFGLPAEQYAVKTGQHPRKTTDENVSTFKRQIRSLGFSYDWSRELATTDPDYFRWTQWIFLRLYNSWFNPASRRAEPIETLKWPAELAGGGSATGVELESRRREYRDARRLAFVSEQPVWWCEQLGTVLANEEVVDGKSEVGGFPVVRRPMRQWMLRITTYAERLLQDLETIEWSDSLKEMQRNWIGRSEGAEVEFQVQGSPDRITVFTTRPDTLYGATYMVLAPEHPLVGRITTPAQSGAVRQYVAEVSKKSDLERTELAKEKTGVPTGAFAVNPANGEAIPIWIADYVLASYGTGAIMAVPAHDERDFEFAKKFGLAIRQVVAPGKDAKVENTGRGPIEAAFCEDGIAMESPPAGWRQFGPSGDRCDFNGLPTPKAKEVITSWLESRGLGRQTIQYKLRDWLFSRQRYWGEPFPIVWRSDAGGKPYHEALPESALPVLPPELTDYKPTATGEPPLTRAKGWVQLPDGAKRETNTMPQWAGSCWYYLRYLDSKNGSDFVSKAAERYWMGTNGATFQVAGGTGKSDTKPTPGVDLYVGGTEHAVLHLLYARFWHKVIFDLGHVSTPEPFYKLVNQGLILGEDGQKMSKSRGNVINPDDILAEYGADAFRLYEMFMGPLEMVKPWSTQGVEGVYRFLGRVWRLFVDEQSATEFEQAETTAAPGGAEELLGGIRLHPAIREIEAGKEQLKSLHACIRKVTEDLEGLRFNTAISALMVFVNEAIAWPTKPAAVLRDFLILLQPFAPHLAEELWDKLGSAFPSAVPRVALGYAPWPAWDAAFLAEDTLEIPVQVNGKLRDVIRVPANATESGIEAAARASEKARPFIEGKAIRKVIVVPRRLVNLIVS
jgi:leucyl-tRNA synthetase